MQTEPGFGDNPDPVDIQLPTDVGFFDSDSRGGIAPDIILPPGALGAKSRYRQTDGACRLLSAAEPDQRSFRLRFDAPQWAVTPGQSAVIYDGEVCLGGGVIAEVDVDPAPDRSGPGPADPGVRDPAGVREAA